MRNKVNKGFPCLLSNSNERGRSDEMEKKTGRNSLDAVMELVELHFEVLRENGEMFTEEDIEKVYLKYYSLIKNNR